MKKLPLAKATELLVDECRMILPGIQALFGLQLIVVFNERFAEELEPGEQLLHLVALALVAVSVALIMAPAVLHRQTGARHVTEAFIRASSRLLLCSMPLLGAGLCVDFYLVARIILETKWAGLLAAALATVFASLWFVLPRANGRARKSEQKD